MIEHPYALDDAAYLLGALNAEERRQYERHLVGCPQCTIAVRDLAGLPGLLARAQPADVLDADPPATTARPTLLAGVPTRVRASRLRRSAALLVTAAACLTALVLIIGGLAANRDTPPRASGTGRGMTHVVPAPIDATVQLTDLSWGTSIVLRCRYSDQPLYPVGPYQLVVIDQAGHAQQAATWQVVPGKVSTITASVDLPRTKIAGPEVRTNTGRSVLRADR